MDALHPDRFRPLSLISEPDLRSAGFGVPGHRKGLAEYHAQVASYVLHPGVPEDVVALFDNARNLFVYGWFVYRFFTVAEHQALVALEFALRNRYEKEIPKSYFRGPEPTLAPLLRYAIDKGDVKHQGFERWLVNARHRAEFRYRTQKIKEMKDRGLQRIELDYSEVKVTDADGNWSYLDDLMQMLPSTRNEYAHGTSSFGMPSARTIELVSEIVNQIYDRSNSLT